MRKELSAISAFSMFISFLAAVVICIQVAQMKLAPEWQISGFTTWAVELAIFGAAVYVWRTRVSFLGWMLGVLGLIAVRLGLTTAAATGLAITQELDSFGPAFARASALAPRVCSAFFALMVFYPLREFLPLRTERVRLKRQFADSPAAALGERGAEGEPAVVLLGRDEDAIPVWESKPKPAETAATHSVTLPLVDIDGAVEIPLRLLLGQLPAELLSETAREYDESHPVSVPLELVLPQLREARVVLALRDLAECLPPETLKPTALSDPESAKLEVQLPLEEVVPQVPAEALALPSPSLPAWARVTVEVEPVVFATV